MRQQRRKRSTRRRGLQHIGDVLSNLMTDLDQDDAIETPEGTPLESVSVPAGAINSQNTFSFYQPVDA